MGPDTFIWKTANEFSWFWKRYSECHRLGAYFHPGFIGITGTPDEVQKVINQYGGFFIKVESDSALGYLVEHTSKTYIISKDGQYVSILPHDMTSDLALTAIRSGL